MDFSRVVCGSRLSRVVSGRGSGQNSQDAGVGTVLCTLSLSGFGGGALRQDHRRLRDDLRMEQVLDRPSRRPCGSQASGAAGIRSTFFGLAATASGHGFNVWSFNDATMGLGRALLYPNLIAVVSDAPPLERGCTSEPIATDAIPIRPSADFAWPDRPRERSNPSHHLAHRRRRRGVRSVDCFCRPGDPPSSLAHPRTSS